MLKSRKIMWIAATVLMLAALAAALITAASSKDYVPDNRATFVLKEESR